MILAGTLLLRRRSGQVLRAGHRGRALQGLPLRRHRHQWHQRGGHAGAGEQRAARPGKNLVLYQLPSLLTMALRLGWFQWEFQVGPSVGISSGDQVWVARYILEVRRHVFLWTRTFVGRRRLVLSCPSMCDLCAAFFFVLFTEDHRDRRRGGDVRPEADPGRLERRGRPHQLQHRVHEEGGRVRGDQGGHREAEAAAQGAHRGLRRGQRAPAHRQARDRRHQHLQLGTLLPRS